MTDAPLISVRGEAVLEVEPEIARLHVHVQSQEHDRRTALDTLVERNQRCLDLVTSYGEAVEKLETGGLSITPLLRQRRREGDIRAYQGTVWIKITVVDFTLLGELVTRLADLERTAVHGPYWELRRDSPVHKEAARQAAHEAVSRARGYAEALGCSLTSLVELTDEGLHLATQPMAQDYAMAAPAAYGGAAEAGGPEAIDLAPETQIVRAAVEARFRATAPTGLDTPSTPEAPATPVVPASPNASADVEGP